MTQGSAHAIVTGSSGGIGAAVCRALTGIGWRISGIDRVPPPPGAAWEHFATDLADRSALTSTTGKITAHGSIDAVVHAAAIQPLGVVGEIDEEQWIEVLRVNVLSLDALIALVGEDLRTRQGSVVAISSVHARVTSRGMAAYATSKAALEGWVRSAALELAPDVRVNAIAPGAVDTAMLRSHLGLGADDFTALIEGTPLHAIGEPAAIASAVRFLITDPAARFMTGSVMQIDGGVGARLATE